MFLNTTWSGMVIAYDLLSVENSDEKSKLTSAPGEAWKCNFWPFEEIMTDWPTNRGLTDRPGHREGKLHFH